MSKADAIVVVVIVTDAMVVLTTNLANSIASVLTIFFIALVGVAALIYLVCRMK